MLSEAPRALKVLVLPAQNESVSLLEAAAARFTNLEDLWVRSRAA